jgi:hypothetical protein
MTRDGQFRKAGASDTGNCVEVAALPAGGVLVRDSKRPGGPVLAVTDGSWRALVHAVKGGAHRLPS